MALPKPDLLSPEAYLEQERSATTKSEYWDGVVVAMSGASRNHNVITMNLLGLLLTQTQGRECRPWGSDTRLSIPACKRYYYPDMMLTCGDEVWEDRHFDSLLNPTLVVGVLSESTAHYDKSEKWDCYQRIPSLQAYMLVAQDSVHIEVYQRQEVGWLYSVFTQIETALDLTALALSLSLASLYKDTHQREED